MKIVHVISGLRMGGAETMLWKLLTASSAADLEQEVVSLTDVGPVGERMKGNGFRIRALGMRGLGGKLAGAVRLPLHLRRSDPDVVQTWLYHADLVGGLAARLGTRAPVVWNLRHSDLDASLGSLHRTVAACARLSRWIPTRIVSCSERARHIHAAIGYPDARMVVIPNGFDLDRFRPDARARAEVRRELRLPADALVVGIVGRYHPQKDHETFLKAAALIAKSRERMRFLLCGPLCTADNMALLSAIERVGLQEACVLAGRREDVERIHAALDVECSSSAFGEGFSNVLGEAMACGVPCVATDVGDAADIIGPTGRVVPRRDALALASAIRALADLREEERRRLGEAARARIAQRFGLASVQARYEALWREVAAEARTRGAAATHAPHPALRADLSPRGKGNRGALPLSPAGRGSGEGDR